MSMSQEEIESLMNGLDLQNDDSSTTEESSSGEAVSEDDINNLINQTQETPPANNDSDVDELLDVIANTNSQDVSLKESDVDELIKGLENSESSVLSESLEQNQSVSNDDIDDLLASIDGVQEDSEPVVPIETKSTSMGIEEKTPDINEKIDNGVFPLPAEQDTKVVSQLSAVANDSEEKASKIFDVLSNILDYNNNIQNDIEKIVAFNKKQIAMLTALNAKFPNIEVFKTSLEEAKSMSLHMNNANSNINDGNNEIFAAMELMQFNDINRQKIERVMSVIRKLSVYLNNLFEDDGSTQEVAVAKYIHGDDSSNELVDGEDLEDLIAEFNK